MARARREGEAFVEIHADTDPFEREAGPGVRRGAERAEGDLKEVGDEWGEVLSEGMQERLTKEGPNLAKSVEKGLGKQRVKVPVEVEYDRDSSAAKRSVTRVFRDIEEAVEEAAGGGGRGGGFGKIGQAFQDAIGAGFNVSGKSPLVAFLLPLVGAIIGLVGAAIQALSALAAVAITLPGILAAVGIQVGVLMLAFKGVGTAIEGAFAAKNAKELKEALKDLTPAAQSFVKELLPLRDFFKRLSSQVQQNFFKEIQGLVTQLSKAQGPTIFDGFLKVSTALGKFFHDLGFFFTGDVFSKFLSEIFPRTVTFLEQFGPAFITFIEGLLSMVNAAMPFLTKVGDIVSMIFKQVGDAFAGVAEDPSFQDWLLRMEDTLMSIIQLFRAAGIFIGALFDAVDRAGGVDIIDKLSEGLIMLAVFLTSDVGVEGLTALFDIAILSIQSIVAFIVVVIAALGALRMFFFWLKDIAGPAILDFFGAAANAVANFFIWVGAKLKEFWDFLWWVFVGGGVNQVMGSIRSKFGGIATYLGGLVNTIKTFFASIPDRVRDAFSNAANFLFSAGRNIVSGLINGIRSMFGGLSSIASEMASRIGRFLPFSPAKEGPLSGRGDPQRSGQTIITRLAEGMEMEAPTLRNASMEATQNIMFGPGSIQMRIDGTMNREQGRDAGRGVAEGIWTNLDRNTRLAIRTM